MPFAPVTLRLQRLLFLLLQLMLQVPRDMQRGTTLGAKLVKLTEQKEIARTIEMECESMEGLVWVS